MGNAQATTQTKLFPRRNQPLKNTEYVTIFSTQKVTQNTEVKSTNCFEKNSLNDE
uniref:Uncharacterized protein n=1 Tax=Anguilla anguilla TaxID=7936 RepID=A0A0E9SQ30_ANGAN